MDRLSSRQQRTLIMVIVAALFIGAFIWIYVYASKNRQGYTAMKSHNDQYDIPESYSDIACLYKNNPACSSDPDCCRNSYPRCGAYYGSKSCCS